MTKTSTKGMNQVYIKVYFRVDTPLVRHMFKDETVFETRECHDTESWLGSDTWVLKVVVLWHLNLSYTSIL